MASSDFRRPLAGVTAVAIVAGAPLTMADQPAAALQSYSYHHADVLGTASDLTVVAPTKADADTADAAVTAEIDRLKKILSAYDADSELSKLNASPVNGPGIAVSPELIDVLKLYDSWFDKTAGAYSGHAGDLLALWARAEKTDQLPTDADLMAAAKKARPAAWKIDPAKKTVSRISDQQINLDSIGKGYVIDKAVAAATKSPTAVKGLMLNIGGDLRTWGSPVGPAGSLWSVGIQDPAHPELNAKPLTTIYIPGNRSVSSSGAYQRYYTVGGKKYSHIIDARTGKTGPNPAATVVADDSATANALATICCATGQADATAVVRATPGADSLIVTASGGQFRTDNFKTLQDPKLAAAKASSKSSAQFPAGFKVTIDLETVQTQRKPYVFVWIVDAEGKHVKTLGAYGNDRRYWRDIRQWWKLAQNDSKLQGITHATQRAGKYPLAWDGTDQNGDGVPPGTYTVWVEVAAEHGPHSAKSASIVLGQEPATAKITASSAFNEVNINYGPGDNK